MRAPLAGTLRCTNLFGGAKFDPPSTTSYDGLPVRVLGHTGIDWDAPPGTPVLAVWPGRISTGTEPDGFGLYAILTVADGRTALYGHLSAISVPDGAHVGAGQQIARSGQSGRATGPHLHLEVQPVRPDWFNGFRGCQDYLSGFDHDVQPQLDLSIVGGFCT